jgi:hypothetical protein
LVSFFAAVSSLAAQQLGSQQAPAPAGWGFFAAPRFSSLVESFMVGLLIHEDGDSWKRMQASDVDSSKDSP